MTTYNRYGQPQGSDDRPTLLPIAHGRWAAIGAGWAVHGDTQEDAIRLFWEAVERHKAIMARPWSPPQEAPPDA